MTAADLYQKMLDDVGPWGRCVRKDDRLIAVIKYREAVLAKYKADNTPKAASGWRWPWQ